ncbi:MAG TPA: hypothetical protein VJU86_19475 [Pyrinomonadaceae bacterium]|nr:hypothetical protein [Pyrinomonadaceae bacterium]
MKFAITIFIVALTAVSAFGQSPPTLRIVTEDPTLPSELFYGDVKVKPLRLRPGTNTPITIDDNDFFIQQHYIDFLARMPEPGGFQGWMNVMTNCGITVAQPCDRIEVSSAFFRSEEFQIRRYFVYRFYSVSFKRVPLYAEFIPDARRISGFQTDAQLEASKVAFMNDFVARTEFKNKYDALNNTDYVNTLVSTAGVTLPNTAQLITDLNNGTKTRAQVLRTISETAEVYNKYYNEAFVVMQYHGYLRRDPDILYLDWINTMNQTGDYRTMINGFMNSAEYRNRF